MSDEPQANSYAPGRFAEEPEAKADHISKRGLAEAMERLFGQTGYAANPTDHNHATGQGWCAHDLHRILHRTCTACHFACTAWVCALSPYTPAMRYTALRMRCAGGAPRLVARFLYRGGAPLSARRPTPPRTSQRPSLGTSHQVTSTNSVA
jgi:hypothetical protein